MAHRDGSRRKSKHSRTPFDLEREEELEVFRNQKPYWQHDDRTLQCTDSHDTTRDAGKESEKTWTHDLFVFNDQGPKTPNELKERIKRRRGRNKNVSSETDFFDSAISSIQVAVKELQRLIGALKIS